MSQALLFFSPGNFVLGIAVGVLGLVLLLSLIVSYAYSERTLSGLAAYLLCMVAATLGSQHVGVADDAVQNLTLVAGPALLAAFEAYLLRSRHTSTPTRAASGLALLATLVLMGLFAFGLSPAVTTPAAVAWAALLLVYSIYLVVLSWNTAGPWRWWLMLGHLAGLLVATVFLTDVADAEHVFWPILLMLLLQVPPIYLSLVWRSRLLNESRLRSISSNVTDPLTGLATTMVLVERLMRVMSRGTQNLSANVIFLIEIQNWQGLLNELGEDHNEKLTLEAAMRLRRSIGDNDLAARLAGGRFAVLAQGLEGESEITTIATRLMVSGLRIDSPLLEGVEFKFRIIVSELNMQIPRSLPETHEWLQMVTGYFRRWPSTHRARSILFVAADKVTVAPVRGLGDERDSRTSSM